MLIIRQGASTINYSRLSSHFTFFSFRWKMETTAESFRSSKKSSSKRAEGDFSPGSAFPAASFVFVVHVRVCRNPARQQST